MDRKELLKSLGLTEEELQDFLDKFAEFQRKLNPAQLKVLVRSLPNIDEARKHFGQPHRISKIFFGEMRILLGRSLFVCS